MAPDILPYDHARDFKAVRRIHYEVGWLSAASEAKAFEKMVQHLDGVVYPIDGEAECAVFTAPGAMRYLDEDVEMCAVLAVTTSRIARKLGAAKQLTAHALATAAEAGQEVATLGMFEQGFYDQLGFGTGAYARAMRFDPATLTVKTPFRRPKRLGRKDCRQIHQAMHRRMRGHGGCVLPTLTVSVGASTRAWLGVRNPSSLAPTDDLQGDETLLVSLGRALRLPQPHFGWDF